MNWLDLTKEQQLWIIRNDNSHSADTPEDITCPWCNAEQNFDFESVNYNDDHNEEYECVECEKKFDVHTSVSVSWETELPREYLEEQALKQFPSREQE